MRSDHVIRLHVITLLLIIFLIYLPEKIELTIRRPVVLFTLCDWAEVTRKKVMRSFAALPNARWTITWQSRRRVMRLSRTGHLLTFRGCSYNNWRHYLTMQFAIGTRYTAERQRRTKARRRTHERVSTHACTETHTDKHTHTDQEMHGGKQWHKTVVTAGNAFHSRKGTNQEPATLTSLNCAVVNNGWLYCASQRLTNARCIGAWALIEVSLCKG